MSSLSHKCGSERYEACSDEATADTTAELGCNPQQGVMDCLCRLIRPAADRAACCSCAAGAMLSPWCTEREFAELS